MLFITISDGYIMKYFKSFIIYAFLIIISSGLIYSQEDVLRPHGKKGESSNEDWSYKRSPFIIGIEGGININLFNQSMSWDPTFQHGTLWNGLASANGISPLLGALIDVDINKTFAFQFRINYDKKDYGLTTSGTDYDIYGQSHDMNLKVDVSSAYLTLTPLLRINATNNLFFTVGPTFHLLLGNIETTWQPTTLDNSTLNTYPYWGGMGFPAITSGSMTVNESGSQKTMRFGLEGGVGYKIPLSKKIFLVPQGRFQFMLTPVTSDTYWVDYNNPNNKIETSSNRMLHSIQLVLALWFEI